MNCQKVLLVATFNIFFYFSKFSWDMNLLYNLYRPLSMYFKEELKRISEFIFSYVQMTLKNEKITIATNLTDAFLRLSSIWPPVFWVLLESYAFWVDACQLKSVANEIFYLSDVLRRKENLVSVKYSPKIKRKKACRLKVCYISEISKYLLVFFPTFIP